MAPRVPVRPGVVAPCVAPPRPIRPWPPCAAVALPSGAYGLKRRRALELLEAGWTGLAPLGSGRPGTAKRGTGNRHPRPRLSGTRSGPTCGALRRQRACWGWPGRGPGERGRADTPLRFVTGAAVGVVGRLSLVGGLVSLVAGARLAVSRVPGSSGAGS